MDGYCADLSPATWAHLGKGLARCYTVRYNVDLHALLLIPCESTLSCPISTEVARDPVMTVDGHVYDNRNIQQWFRTRYPPTSPSTGLTLPSRALFPLQLFKVFVQSYMNNSHEIRDSYVGVRAMEEVNCTLRSELETLKKELSARDMEIRRLEMRLAELRDARDFHARLVEVYSAIARDSQHVLKIQKGVRRFLRRRNAENEYKDDAHGPPYERWAHNATLPDRRPPYPRNAERVVLPPPLPARPAGQASSSGRGADQFFDKVGGYQQILAVDQIRYSSASITDRFSDGRHLEELVDALVAGDVDPLNASFLVLDVVSKVRDGVCEYYTSNNQFLHCLHRYQKKVRHTRWEVWVNVKCVEADYGVVSRYFERFDPKWDGDDCGLQIDVVPAPSQQRWQ